MVYTPARTPAPGDLEYLDVFDFFNVPRLPTHPGAAAADTNGGGHDGNGTPMDAPHIQDNALNGFNEFNITNFMFDASTDWLGS